MYVQARATRTIYGPGENLLICGSGLQLPPEATAKKGEIQFVYLDPPFMTGESFDRKRAYGEQGWKKGSPTLTVPGYVDKFADDETYLAFLRGMIENARVLLRQEGVFCLHLDWRMSSQARLLCDQIFGKEMFLNEIIWAYESGGRSKKFFPRKHDTILMYARSKKYRFDLSQVPIPRGENRKNHMARKIDEEGRSYSSIISGGKEYRYYDDDPVYPGDVWTDISILQQKDPERTGYPTQKPLKLLERLMKPVVQEGDWVADLCCGSGTTVAAAERIGCHFLGLDANPETISVAAARLKAENLTILSETAVDGVESSAVYDPATKRVKIGALNLAGAPYPAEARKEDLTESWELGRLEGEVFRGEKRYQRSFQYPALVDDVVASGDRIPDLLMTDAAGIRRIYTWKE